MKRFGLALLLATISVSGPALGECPVRIMLIFRDGRVQFDGAHGAILEGSRLKAEIRKMAGSSCPPIIHGKGGPQVSVPVLQEFRLAGYDMSKIIFD